MKEMGVVTALEVIAAIVTIVAWLANFLQAIDIIIGTMFVTLMCELVLHSSHVEMGQSAQAGN